MGSLGVSQFHPEPIAIIGHSCKFAGDAENPEAFWRLLNEAKRAWTAIPSSRFNATGSYNRDPERLSSVCVRCSVIICLERIRSVSK